MALLFLGRNSQYRGRRDGFAKVRGAVGISSKFLGAAQLEAAASLSRLGVGVVQNPVLSAIGGFEKWSSPNKKYE
jgi:hypothetical protein